MNGLVLRVVDGDTDPQTVADFYALHSNLEEEDGCFCVAWWTRTWNDWEHRTVEENRQLRKELFSQGHRDGYLLYVEGQVAAWCQCGVRDRLPKLLETYDLEPDPRVWAFTCFVVSNAFREQGLTHRLLELVLKDLAAEGVGIVQGFPRRGADLQPDAVWQGPEAIFHQAGFALVRDDENWPIYQKKLTI